MPRATRSVAKRSGRWTCVPTSRVSRRRPSSSPQRTILRRHRTISRPSRRAFRAHISSCSTDAAHVATYEQPARIAALLQHHLRAGATLADGYATRRQVLGDAHVDRAIAATTPLTSSFQDFITRYAWGDIWSRSDLARRDRSIATLAALVTLGAEHELAMHIRAARRNGLADNEIVEVLMQCALYAGLPRANRAIAIAAQILR